MTQPLEAKPLGLAKTLAFACIPALVLLLVAESIVRWTGAGDTCPMNQNSTLWACDPILHFKLNPALIVRGTPLNHAGFRSREFGAKQPGTLRILALGDSCTFGITAADRGFYVAEPYPQRLQRMVEERDGHGRVEVLNAAVPGYNSFHGVMLLRTKLRDLAPDLITVRFGWNDHLTPQATMANAYRESSNPIAHALEDLALHTKLYPFSKRLGMELRLWMATPTAATGPRLPAQWTPTVTLSDYKEHLRRIYQIGRRQGSTVWLLTSPHALLTPAALARFEHLPANATARTMLNLNAIPSFKQLAEIHQTYNAATREVGAELGIRVIDMDTLYRTRNRPDLFSMMDALHPTQEGHDLEAQALYEQLLTDGLLRREAATPAESASCPTVRPAAHAPVRMDTRSMYRTRPARGLALAR
jgi:lysophospholipase L1-like esterase